LSNCTGSKRGKTSDQGEIEEEKEEAGLMGLFIISHPNLKIQYKLKVLLSTIKKFSNF
jgi:hypothetical protein